MIIKYDGRNDIIVRFETDVFKYNEDDDGVVGCSVTIYEDNGDMIDTIEIADADQLQALEDALDVIDETYMTNEQIISLLRNISGGTTINATTLNGEDGSNWVTSSQLSGMSFYPKAHASASTLYGVGSNNNYGHVKVRNDLSASTNVTGEALSSYQGKVLNDKINAIPNPNTINYNRPHSNFQLLKNNKVVTLSIANWDCHDYSSVTGQWVDVDVIIPSGYKPASDPGYDPVDIYWSNILGNDKRMRWNFSREKLQLWQSDGSTQKFYAHVTWICK